MPQSADKKPEKYVGPDGKTKIRMVAVDKEVVKTEATDDQYHKTLANTKNSDEGIAALKKNHGMSHTKATATLKRLMGESKTFRQLRKVAEAKVDEISLNDLKTKIAKSGGTSNVSKAMNKDKTKSDLDAMKARLAAETYGDDEPASPDEKSMDKKMAIATATAKRVAEVSSNKLGDYMRASSKDVSKSRGDARRQDKRIAGQSMADKKIRKKMGYSSTAKVPAGQNENEQTDLDKIRSIIDRNKK